MMREKDRSQIKCQIYIEQRGRGTVWVPCKMLIGYGVADQFGSENQDDHFYSRKEFATLGAAVEAAQQNALHVIQEKRPSVCRDDVDWCLVSKDVSGFVPV